MNHKTLALICLLALALAALVGCTSAATTSTAESTSETTTADATAETADTAAATDTTTDDATTDSTTSDSADALQFPVDSYTEETVTVTTSTGDVEVTYRLYSHIPYVANPVNTDYQSLDVKVPVSINGEAIDATNAPMLLVINVGGYMSVSNAETRFPAPLPTRTRASASLVAEARSFMNAPFPTFTSSTSASIPSASFFERIDATIRGIHSTVAVTSRNA